MLDLFLWSVIILLGLMCLIRVIALGVDRYPRTLEIKAYHDMISLILNGSLVGMAVYLLFN